VVALVLVVIVGVAVAVQASGTPATQAPARPDTLVSAPDSESSAWYCAGQSTPSGAAPGLLVLTNTTTRAVNGTITTVTDTGAVARTDVAVPALTAVVPQPPAPGSGAWEAQVVTLAAGGVAVTQAAQIGGSWTVTPCRSTTAPVWYFPGGTTATGSGLGLSMLNPTSTPVVVDLSMVTPTGTVHPINYQGIVLQPGQVVFEDVAAEVQNVSTVSMVATARTGRFVAAEVQAFPSPTSGLSLLSGYSHPQRHWVIPQAEEQAGGSSEIDVFNPGDVAESVTVHLRVASGPLAPLSETVAPGSTWVLATSSETRIPAGAAYTADVEASGGPGVVVGRTVHAPPSATAPQSGLSGAVDGLTISSPTGEWVVPPPGTATAQPVSGAAPSALALANTSSDVEDYTAFAVSNSTSGERPLASGTLTAHATLVVSGSALAAAGLGQIIVRSSGPMAVSEDVSPSGSIGVVTMPGLPLAAPIGGL
jgi:hypothetical protein